MTAIARRQATSPRSPTKSAGRSRGEPFDLLEHPMFFFAHILTRFDGNVVVDLHRHGFSQSDWRIISTLHHSDNLTLTEVARITTLERSFIGRMVGDLEKRGYVRRFFPDDDRRTTRVTLTEQGRVSFRDILAPTTLEQIAQAFDRIDEADRAVLFRVLQQMMRNVYRVAREATPVLD